MKHLAKILGFGALLSLSACVPVKYTTYEPNDMQSYTITKPGLYNVNSKNDDFSVSESTATDSGLEEFMEMEADMDKRFNDNGYNVKISSTEAEKAKKQLEKYKKNGIINKEDK